jgi:hypothetical protein
MSPPPSSSGPEAEARIEIDAALETAGWVVQNGERELDPGATIRKFRIVRNE